MFLKPISFSVLAAKADLPPAAQNKTVSLFTSTTEFLTKGLFGLKENSNKPLGICVDFSTEPKLTSSLSVSYTHLTLPTILRV